MKIFKLFVALAAFVLSLGAQAADTRYDFSLAGDAGFSVSGSFIGTFDNDLGTFQGPTSFSGTLFKEAGSEAPTGVVSGNISGLTVNRDSTGWQLGFQITTVGNTAYYLWNTTDSSATLTMPGVYNDKPVTAFSDTVGVRFSSYSGFYGNDIAGTPAPYIGVQVPEIDGSKLPQAALLILALVFMVRRLKASRPAPGFTPQFA